MEKLLIHLKSLILNLSLLLLSILLIPFFLLSPFFLFFPLFLWRSLVGHLGKCLDGKKLGLMSARNSVVAIDEIYTGPEQSIVVTIGFNRTISTYEFSTLFFIQKLLPKFVHMIESIVWGFNYRLSGLLDFDEIFQRYAAIFMEKEASYPELRKYYESWGGYLFWKEDEAFDLKNHYKLYKEGQADKVSHDEMEQFCLQLVKEPFPKKRSPWEVIQVNNFIHRDKNPSEPGVSVLIFHVHHGLCDGFSILQLLTTMVDQWDATKGHLPMAKWSKGVVRPKVWHYVVMAMLAPYNLLRQGLSTYDVNPFRLNGNKLTRKMWTAQIQVPIDTIKEIKGKWGVTFSAVVYAAIAGGFRNYMVNHARMTRAIPQVFHMGLPFPWPHRRERGMQNNMCVCIAKLAVGPADIRERVKMCEKYWGQVKSSTVPLMNWTLMPLMGLFPDFLVKLFVRNNLTTIVLSNFPGPSERLHIVGTNSVNTEEVDFVTGLWRGNCGIGIGLISCNGVFKINIGVDQALVSSKGEVEKIKKFIENELKILSLGKNEVQV